MTVVPRPARGVLLVEDQTPIPTLLAEALERAGFEVTACATSKADLAAFPKIDPDLLVADIDLGSRPNGVELATILRAKALAWRSPLGSRIRHRLARHGRRQQR